MTTTKVVEGELLGDFSVYENEHYVVLAVDLSPEGADPYVDGKSVYWSVYQVINRGTGIMEHQCVQLPEAIFTAVGLSAALNKAPWNASQSVADAAPAH